MEQFMLVWIEVTAAICAVIWLAWAEWRWALSPPNARDVVGTTPLSDASGIGWAEPRTVVILVPLILTVLTAV